jgi:hypothetical protein
MQFLLLNAGIWQYVPTNAADNFRLWHIAKVGGPGKSVAIWVQPTWQDLLSARPCRE